MAWPPLTMPELTCDPIYDLPLRAASLALRAAAVALPPTVRFLAAD